MKTITRQLSFLVELDRLKSIIRQSPPINRSREENSAEHSWHLAMFALVLSEYAADAGRA
jgi:putative hydrolase of HD superfamily